MKKQFFSIIMLLSMTTSMVAGQSQSRTEFLAAKQESDVAVEGVTETPVAVETTPVVNQEVPKSACNVADKHSFAHKFNQKAAKAAELEVAKAAELEAANAAKAAETPVVKSYGDYLTNAGSAISKTVSNAGSAISKTASKATSVITETASKATSAISKTVSEGASAVTEKTSQVASIIKENPKASAAGVVGVVGLAVAAKTIYNKWFKSSPKKLTNQFDYKALVLNFLVAYKLEGDNATEVNLTDKFVVDALAKITDEEIKSLESNVFLQDNSDTCASFVIIDSIELHFSMKTTSIEEMQAVLSCSLSTVDINNSALSTSNALPKADAVVTAGDAADAGAAVTAGADAIAADLKAATKTAGFGTSLNNLFGVATLAAPIILMASRNAI